MKTNHKRLTKEFCQQNTLIFWPRTTAEAAYIQQQLFGMGFKWCKDYGAKITEEAKCVQEGLLLFNGTIWTKPLPETIVKAWLCTAEQFDADYVSEHEQVMQVFNTLAERVTALEKRIFEPDVISKPALSKPGKKKL